MTWCDCVIQPQHDGIDQRQEYLRDAVALVWSRITDLLGEEVSETQHSQKFMEQMDSTEVRETRMVKGDSHAPWRSAHYKPYLTKKAM